MRYRYYKAGPKTICVSSFAGKPVRGVAICASDDEHDEKIGEDLARLRCDLKIAKKRKAHAHDCATEAWTAARQALRTYDKYAQYYEDASNELTDLRMAYDDLIERI